MKRTILSVLRLPSAAQAWLIGVLGFLAAAAPAVRLSAAEGPDFSDVQTVFNRHCLDCHAAEDPEAGLVLENFSTLMKGGESGASIVPGKAAESLLVRMIEGNAERDGKKRAMPPGKRKKLDSGEIAAVREWVEAGAKPPIRAVAKPSEFALANLPKIAPKVPPRRSITALASAPKGGVLASARGTDVELIDFSTRTVLRTLAGHRGQVNALAFSPDGQWLYAAAGEPGLFGEVREWRVADGQRMRLFEGHADAIYSVALSPDGRLMATGSYDQKVRLWRIETVEEIALLSGHNGCVHALAFRSDGRLLASASADRTVKLWSIPGGERRDTLSQSLKELYTVAFSPDGRRLYSGGGDNRIRLYEISDKASETTNPLIEARFAHEGAILKLVLSPDGKTLLTSAEDRTVKLWNAATLVEIAQIERQPDWALALAFTADGKAAVAGRFDGTLGWYDAATGKPLAAPKPELTRAEPRGIQRGTTVEVKLSGARLRGATGIRFSTGKITGELFQREGASSETEVWARITAAPDLTRGAYDLWLVSEVGESGRIQWHADDLPQVVHARRSDGAPTLLAKLPVDVWSVFGQPGDADEFAFDAAAGETLVFDAAARSLGSKADLVVTLSDSQGRVLASNNGFDGSPDPFLGHTFADAGRYKLRLHELSLAGSVDHFYRLTIGSLPYVTGVFPLSARAGGETEIHLSGVNLPAGSSVRVKPETSGELALPLDLEKFRSRRTFQILTSDMVELLEAEPNDAPAQATPLSPPCAVGGRIAVAGDADLFRFTAKAGEQWIIETEAARRGSPIDTKIEVLSVDGRPVPRVQLQAVRNSAVTFRGIDSGSADCRLENWEEMELNQFLYLQGEVVQLFRAPQGPDSGFVFYTSNGQRRCFYDTSATAHAVDEPCFIVEPHPPGTKLVSNGLPVFTLHYENDDDGGRRLGSDSRVHFTAPADGAYLVRVTDTRGYSGDRFAYRLLIRKPQPDFEITLNGTNPVIGAGSGQSFTLSVVRKDGFEGEIRVDIGGLPPGFSASTPVIIQAGQSEARGTIHAASGAPKPAEVEAAASMVTASAEIEGRPLVRAVNNFGRVQLGEAPRLFVGLVSEAGSPVPTPRLGEAMKPWEITLTPGQTVPAWLKVRRNGHEELITFTVDNLPHGVIVDNIGLNGVLIPKGQSEREIFLTAARWVPEMDRWCFAIESQAGRQTSVPVLVKIRRGVVASTGK